MCLKTTLTSPKQPLFLASLVSRAPSRKTFFPLFVLNRTMIFLDEKEMDDLLAKLAAARIHLAKAYSNLVLGGGMAQQCHMSRGR